MKPRTFVSAIVLIMLSFVARDTHACYPQCNHPTAFNLSSPSDGATCLDPYAVTLTWQSSQYASSYEVYVNGVLSSSTPSLQAGQSYSWYVIAYGCAGYQVSNQTFTFSTGAGKATNPNPVNDACDVNQNTTLSWTAVTGAQSYDVYFGTTTSPPCVSSNQTDTNYTPQGLEPNTTYHWRVNSKLGSCTTVGTNWKFTTDDIPSGPNMAIWLSNPHYCQDYSNGILLQWISTAGATSYEVYFGTLTTPPLVDTVSDPCWPTPTLVPDTKYFWRVKACGQDGCSDFSDLCSFVTATVGLNKAMNPFVDDSTGDVILRWSPDQGAGSQTIWLGTDPNELYFIANTQNAVYNLGPLEPNVYYWKVDQFSNCWTSGGDVWSFTVHNVWYVNNASSGGLNNGTSWENAFHDLQSALNVADPNGDEIWVAAGWEPYYPSKLDDPSDGRSATFKLVNNVSIYGGFDGTERGRGQRNSAENVTILNGDIGQWGQSGDNCYHVVSCVDVNNAIFDGFTIIDGNANGSSAKSNGGGVYSEQSSLTIANCHITENTAAARGGGIYCKDGNAVLVNCVITDNNAADGGGMSNVSCSPLITNCTFTENLASGNGGGMFSTGASSHPIVWNSIFWGNIANDGNEVLNSDGAEPNFGYCDVQGSKEGGSWHSSLGIDGGGNIDEDPVFDVLIPREGLAANWKLDEGNGANAFDLIGGFDGHVGGTPQWTQGHIIGALAFNGSSTDVNLGDIDLFDNAATPITIAMWIKPTGIKSSSLQMFFDKIYPVDEVSSKGFSFSAWLSTGKISFTMKSAVDSDWLQVYGDSVLQDDVWTFVAVTYSGSMDSNGINLYVNDKQEQITVNAPEPPAVPYDHLESSDINTDVEAAIGSRWSGSEHYRFNGAIDEVVIYTRALPAWEVYQVYNAGLWRLGTTSPCINAGDPNSILPVQHDADNNPRIEAMRIDIGAYECPLRVYNTAKSKWYEKIQSAIDDADSGNEIVVYPGQYIEKIDFEGKSCYLRSVDPNDWAVVRTTIIDGGGDPCDPNTLGHTVSFKSGEGDSSILHGLTITGGYASGDQDANNGGGIYCNDSSPIIRRCIIIRNTAEGDGGGAYICNSASPTMENCIFSENAAKCGGAMCNSHASPSLINCTLARNSARFIGGALFNDTSDANIQNCIVWENVAIVSDGAIHNESSEPNISYSDIEGCKDINGLWQSEFGVDNGGNFSFAPYYSFDANGTWTGLLDYSPCIDAGDPASDFSCEPADQGNQRIDIGAYGNTEAATLAGGDFDNDGIKDGWEVLHWPYDDPNLHDPNDDDDDDDINNLEEYHAGTDPNNPDTDSDGIDDGWEYHNGLNSLDPIDATWDEDNDGLSNLQEYLHGTDFTDSDTDNDGMPDGWEVNNQLNACDGNDASQDFDDDDLNNLAEYNAITNPRDKDTDRDGMGDGWELSNNLNPINASDAGTSLDADGYSNLVEYLHGTDPNDAGEYPSESQTIIINVPSDVCNIQTAINGAIDGDVIVVAQGAYYETINFNGKAVTVRSTAPNDWATVESTVIDGNGAGSVVTFSSSEEPNSVLSGFTITDGNGTYSGNWQYLLGGGVFVSNSSPTISRCLIAYNGRHEQSLLGGGIACLDNGNPCVEGCIIRDDTSNYGGGIFCWNSKPIFKNCIISNNNAANGGAIYCGESADANFVNCTIGGNIADNDGGGIYNSCSTPTIRNCILWDNVAKRAGNEVQNDSNSGNCSHKPTFKYCDVEDSNGSGVQVWWTLLGNDGGGNIDLNPMFRNAASADYHLSLSSPCINAGDTEYDYEDMNDIDGTPRVEQERADIGADEYSPVYNVTSGLWYGSIQAAIDGAIDGDIIEVSRGTYVENVDFDGLKCVLTSTDPNDWAIVAATVIEANDVNLPTVTFGTSEDANSIIRGFTIKGGSSGIYCCGAAPIISNCLIRDNNTVSNGGGIYDANSSPLIEKCFVVYNHAQHGGGIYDFNSSATIVSSVISNNTADANGGGICFDESQSLLTNCTLTQNDAGLCGGGISNSRSDPTVANCVIWGNEADDGNSVYIEAGLEAAGDPNLVGWWKFDETSGTTAEDSAGSYDGTCIGGPNWVDGTVDGGLDFDGTDDYVSVTHDPALNITGDITISAWAYFAGLVGSQTIVAKTLQNGQWDNPFDFRAEGSSLMLVRADSMGHDYTYSTEPLLSGQQWHHVLIKVENKVPDFYIDGVVTGKTTQSFTRTPTGNTKPLLIGKRDDGYRFTGLLDDVRIYNRAVSAADIRVLSGRTIYLKNNDIQGCGGSDNWNTDFGIDGGGNIDAEPNFIDTGLPVGPDGLFGTVDDGYSLAFFSPCVNTGDSNALPDPNGRDIKGDNRIINSIDMGAYEYNGDHIICVDSYTDGNNDGTSWEDAFTTLQDALAVAVSGDEVWVAAGIYTPTSASYDRYASFRPRQGVTLYGGFQGHEGARWLRKPRLYQTVISGEIGQIGYGDNSFHVVELKGNNMLDGFVIGGGNADYSGQSGDIDYKCGAGIYCEGPSITIANCTISNNKANFLGGGLFSKSSSLSLTNCIFAGNRAYMGAAIYATRTGNSGKSNLQLTNCAFAENVSSKEGTALRINHVDADLTNCTISQSGLQTTRSYEIALWYSTLALKNSIIWGECAEYKPVYIVPQTSAIQTGTKTETIEVLSTVRRIVSKDAPPPICNPCPPGAICPAVMAPLWCSKLKQGMLYEDCNGNAWYPDTGPMPVTNPSCPYNHPRRYWYYFPVDHYETVITPIYAYPQSTDHSSVSATYCDIKGGLPGAGNMDYDPYFLDSAAPAGPDMIFGTPDDGLRLYPIGMCVDAANGSVAPQTDLLGLPRTDVEWRRNSGTGKPRFADIGAYEAWYGMDSDGDGMADDWEIFYGLNPNDANDGVADLDNDGLPNSWEYMYGLLPCVEDATADTDGDGILNIDEYDYGLNPLVDDSADDSDNDGMPNKWEIDHELNPSSADDANGTNDGDTFTNLVEYLFDYDLNQTDSAALALKVSMPPFVEIDPTNDQVFMLEYAINKAATVTIKFRRTDATNWDSPIRTINHGSIAQGRHLIVWDCKDGNEHLVKPYFYDVNITAASGGENASWATTTQNSAYYPTSTGRIMVNANGFNPYSNVPATIQCDMLDWATREIDIVADNLPSSRVFRLTDYNFLLKPGWNTLRWYGYGDSGDTNNKIYNQAFDVNFSTPKIVKKSPLLIYYDGIVRNLICSPNRMLSLSDEVVAIQYELAYDANVTISVYYPPGNGSSFPLVTNQHQTKADNPHTVLLHGTSSSPSAGDTYLSQEGVYRIEVTASVGEIVEKQLRSVTIYK